MQSCRKVRLFYYLFEGDVHMTRKNKIMDDAAIARSMARITHEILERNNGTADLCLLGVRRRGVPLAAMLAENIRKFEGVDVPLGYLDIAKHRDDLSKEEKENLSSECHIPCDIRDKTVIIVDDVMFTGRTARAAMEAVFAHERPHAVQLAVLIDRGHRELPIRPDYIGKNVPTAKNEKIKVEMQEIDGDVGVYICDL